MNVAQHKTINLHYGIFVFQFIYLVSLMTCSQVQTWQITTLCRNVKRLDLPEGCPSSWHMLSVCLQSQQSCHCDLLFPVTTSPSPLQTLPFAGVYPCDWLSLYPRIPDNFPSKIFYFITPAESFVMQHSTFVGLGSRCWTPLSGTISRIAVDWTMWLQQGVGRSCLFTEVFQYGIKWNKIQILFLLPMSGGFWTMSEPSSLCLIISKVCIFLVYGFYRHANACKTPRGVPGTWTVHPK